MFSKEICRICGKKIGIFTSVVSSDDGICCEKCYIDKNGNLIKIPDTLIGKKTEVDAKLDVSGNSLSIKKTSNISMSIHILFFVSHKGDNWIFYGIEKATGRLFNVKYEEYYNGDRQQDHIILQQLSYADFRKELLDFPTEIKETFAEISSDNWKDYLGVCLKLEAKRDMLLNYPDFSVVDK